MNERIAVVGLGYVGLPVALAFARKFECTLGYDIDRRKVELLREGVDETGQFSRDEICRSALRVSSNPEDLRGVTFYVVAVPTPVDSSNRPDLRPLISASQTVGRVLAPGAVVVYESTVYPGVTEDVCGPMLAESSGLCRGLDFKIGYSPERINPGDHEHRLETIVKIVSGEDHETLERVAGVYDAIIEAGVHRAPTIKVAEAAKAIENTQRDLNVALMNEVALIFDRLNISTRDVLAAAATKWNFLPFSPGLVGGHCIGVDPYYLTTKAEEIGYHPQVILAGRRINDGMGQYIAQRLVKLLIHSEIPVKSARIGILGLTFKEDLPDLRNSRIPDIVSELKLFGIDPLIHDPLADPDRAWREYKLKLASWEEMRDLDGVVVAVGHRAYREMRAWELRERIRPGGVLMDVKSIFDRSQLENLTYWSL